ncbi:hypothetical protein F0L74_25795 [Chitinophaga agrisoli]|uniref:Galactose oxidase-like protein n=1 Tax=Chitinophaga agrisoli TaxID=2607653 RepID=A0A5B2VLL8_9BACT|nr:kelch repeat-containing protein [Chitinophaga agrisoli]KAA2239608.1 hypothetical protein F0L74_25795 [Chitinophaga agrisoli]
MDKYSLKAIDNTISDTNADVSFAIVCSNPDSTTQIKYLEVDLQSLANIVDWDRIRPVITSPAANCIVNPTGSPKGTIRFTFIAQTNFKACKNWIQFKIASVQKIQGQQLPPSAPILFKLKNVSDKPIGNYPDDYAFSTILVAAKKPIIRSCRINPSITRESTDITITYETLNASICELKDKSGQIVNTQTVADKTKPFRFSGKIHLGSVGTFPAPPFYLHARDGAMEAQDNTVADIKVPASPDWIVMDNFSRSVPVNDDKYITEQSTVLDLVQNEADDMIWAIMQKKADLPSATTGLPCIWKSPDGLNWMLHTYSALDSKDNVISPVELTIPLELVHCPCVHFGAEELFFVGGSKVDINLCRNTITAVNLNTGGIRHISAPDAMKPRAMHACIIYPDPQGNNNIWVIGGADKNGNGLNDVWRFDGINWTAVPTGHTDFPKRCQFAATVQTDIKGAQSIWIGGGAARYNGSTLNDLWMYKGNSWIKVRNGNGTADLNYGDDWLTAASMCYVRTAKNTNPDPSNTYRYMLSNDITGDKKQLQCSWIVGVDTGNNYYKWIPLAGINKPELPPIFDNLRSFAMTSIGFNGCAWTVVIAYITKGHTAVSSLYYSCPIP